MLLILALGAFRARKALSHRVECARERIQLLDAAGRGRVHPVRRAASLTVAVTQPADRADDAAYRDDGSHDQQQQHAAADPSDDRTALVGIRRWYDRTRCHRDGQRNGRRCSDFRRRLNRLVGALDDRGHIQLRACAREALRCVLSMLVQFDECDSGRRQEREIVLHGCEPLSALRIRQASLIRGQRDADRGFTDRQGVRAARQIGSACAQGRSGGAQLFDLTIQRDQRLPGHDAAEDLPCVVDRSARARAHVLVSDGIAIHQISSGVAAANQVLRQRNVRLERPVEPVAFRRAGSVQLIQKERAFVLELLRCGAKFAVLSHAGRCGSVLRRNVVTIERQ